MLHRCMHDRSSVGNRAHWGRNMARSAVGPDAVHTVQRSRPGVNQGFDLPSGAALLGAGHIGLCIARRRCFSLTLRFLSDTPLYFHPGNTWAIHIDDGESIALLNNRLTALRNMPQTC